MATLNKASYEAKYNDAGTGLFKTGQSRGIGSDDTRTLVEDTTDSVPFTADDSYIWPFPGAETSSTNTYTATLSPAITAYVNKMKVHIKIKTASTGASTLNLNSIGAKKIFINPTTQAGSGDLVDEQEYIMSYDSALDTAVGGWLILGGTGSGSVESVTGENNAVDNTDPTNPVVRNSVREVTSADASVLADNNGLVILNSATPFNFTLDQLAQYTKISFINYGAGAVTFLAGSGVTITGPVVISGAVGDSYPSGLIIYDTLTTPRVVTGQADADVLDLLSADTSGATITLDFGNKIQRMFIGSASFGTAKAIALDNDTAALVLNMKFNLTNVAAVLTFPTSFTMQTADSRWADGAHTFTPQLTGVHEFSATFDGTDWGLKVSTPFA